MLTIVSVPKSFRGQIGILQRNAIQSWTRLQPKPEILLLGDEEGTTQIANEFGLVHVPHVEKNAFGTPLVNSIFTQAQAFATHDYILYVNADIIFLDDLMDAFQRARTTIKDGRFVMIGLRTNINIVDPIDFSETCWRERLRQFVHQNGSIDHNGIDYYLFPRNAYTDLPPLAIGRYFWDAWLLYKAKSVGLKLVDCSATVKAIHQNHASIVGVGSAKKVFEILNKNSEIRRNWKLVGWYPRCFSIYDADYVMTGSGVRSPDGVRRLKGLYFSAVSIFAYDVMYPLYPWSYPVLWLGSVISRMVTRKVLGRFYE